MELIILSIISILAIIILLVGIIFMIKKFPKVNLENEKTYYASTGKNWRSKFQWLILVGFFIYIIGGVVVGILMLSHYNKKAKKYKKYRESITNKLNNYAKENNLNFDEGDGYTRVCIDKKKKTICIYKESNIIKLNFDNILKIETYNNDILEVYGNEYFTDSNTYYDNSEIKIYTDIDESVISLKYIRDYSIDKVTINTDILNYVEEAEKMLNYALSHKTKTELTENTSSTANEIREFKKLLDEGIITREEFENKKKQLLN